MKERRKRREFTDDFKASIVKLYTQIPPRVLHGKLKTPKC